MADFIWEDEAYRCCEKNDGENGHRFSSDIPALKLGWYLTGIAAETTASIFLIKWLYLSGKMPIRPLFSPFHAVKASKFPVQRH